MQNKDIYGRNEELITKLVRLWYSCLIDYHKDRDCHWYFGTHYKYHGEREYYIEHNGYLLGDIYKTFDNYYAAEKFLVDTLRNAVREEATHWLKSEDEFITEVSKCNLRDTLKQLENL